MPMFNARQLFTKTQTDDVIATEKSHHDSEGDKEAGITTEKPASDDGVERISEEAQAGVRKIEATTLVWSKSHLIAAYILIWCIYFVDALQNVVGWQIVYYATSSFSAHSLTATTSVVSSIVGGITALPLSKVLDIWGRPQGFALMVLLETLGIVMMAACQNVQTYAAAQVFYTVGFTGLLYSLSVFVSDTTHLKNRGMMFAFTSSPYIITCWIGGPIATSFLNGAGWRWGYGIFAIIVPVVTLPLFGLFVYNYHKAKKAGLLPVIESNRTFRESVWFYVIEFDLVAIVLISGGLALFLLPFSLYTRQADGWKSPMIICMLVFGIVLLILFALYERFIAPKTFLPYDLLMDRTLLGAAILGAVLFVEFYIWDSYFSSFLQVVNNLGVTPASYIVNIYSVGSCLWCFVIGYWIRYTGHYKKVALYFGVPLTCLGVGLMIAFRAPDVNVGYIIMCQIFIAFSGGTLVITSEIAALASASHQHIAVVLAILGMFSNIGGAIGSTVAGAIWMGVFPKRLAQYLPEESAGDFALIYGDLTQQLSYPVGSPTRDAINQAYGDAQRYMLISATAVLALAFVCVAVWRDIDVRDRKQTKGRVV